MVLTIIFLEESYASIIVEHYIVTLTSRSNIFLKHVSEYARELFTLLRTTVKVSWPDASNSRAFWNSMFSIEWYYARVKLWFDAGVKISQMFCAMVICGKGESVDFSYLLQVYIRELMMKLCFIFNYQPIYV